MALALWVAFKNKTFGLLQERRKLHGIVIVILAAFKKGHYLP